MMTDKPTKKDRLYVVNQLFLKGYTYSEVARAIEKQFGVSDRTAKSDIYEYRQTFPTGVEAYLNDTQIDYQRQDYVIRKLIEEQNYAAVSKATETKLKLRRELMHYERATPEQEAELYTNPLDDFLADLQEKSDFPTGTDD